MRTLFQKILYTLPVLVLLSCDDNITQPEPAQTVVQFQLTQQTLHENNADGVTVPLVLNKAADMNGSITLQIAADMQHRLVTNPAHSNGVLSLPVTKGDSQLEFTVTAVDNLVMDGNQTIAITLQPSVGLTAGVNKMLQLTILDNDEEVAQQSVAEFEIQQDALSENANEELVYSVMFKPAVAQASEVTITIVSSNSNAFSTAPASVNNTITVQAPAGTSALNFTVAAIDNSEFNGHTEVEFTIANTTGSVVKGTHIKQRLTIVDDELAGKLWRYEVTGPEGSEKRTYEYDSKGRIARIIKEKNAPFNPTILTDTYFYDDQNRVVKINAWTGRDILYTWNNNRIERAEVFQDDELIQYANYAYDDAGNMGAVEPFYKQRDGSFVMSGITVYLYFEDGNVFKALWYNNPAGGEEPQLITTRTYDQYLDAAAPVSMFEILPSVKFQKNLAGSYRYENHSVGQDITYQLSYEFREDGLPVKRIATAPGETQTTSYYYY